MGAYRTEAVWEKSQPPGDSTLMATAAAAITGVTRSRVLPATTTSSVRLASEHSGGSGGMRSEENSAGIQLLESLRTVASDRD